MFWCSFAATPFCLRFCTTFLLFLQRCLLFFFVVGDWLITEGWDHRIFLQFLDYSWYLYTLIFLAIARPVHNKNRIILFPSPNLGLVKIRGSLKPLVEDHPSKDHIMSKSSPHILPTPGNYITYPTKRESRKIIHSESADWLVGEYVMVPQEGSSHPNFACTSLRAFSRWLCACLSFAKHSWKNIEPGNIERTTYHQGHHNAHTDLWCINNKRITYPKLLHIFSATHIEVSGFLSSFFFPPFQLLLVVVLAKCRPCATARSARLRSDSAKTWEAARLLEAWSKYPINISGVTLWKLTYII